MWARRLRAAIHRFSAHAARSLEALLLRTQINAFTNICVMTLMFMRHLSGPTRSRWLSAVAAGRERGGNIPSFQYLVREGAASRRDKKELLPFQLLVSLHRVAWGSTGPGSGLDAEIKCGMTVCDLRAIQSGIAGYMTGDRRFALHRDSTFR